VQGGDKLQSEKFDIFSDAEEKDAHALNLYIVSDFTAETASSLVRAAIRQFDSGLISLRRFRYVDTLEKIDEVCRKAREEEAIIVCTLVRRSMRVALRERAQTLGIVAVELFGPLLEGISDRLGVEPFEQPGASHKMDAEYFRRVKAIEFASTCDDGANPQLLPEADLVIMGVSRTCKTPLSMYLANKGVRTANVPLVPELAPPEQLFGLAPGKIVGLTISMEALRQIRYDRLKIMGLDPETAVYAKEDRVRKELEYSNRIMEKTHAKVVNVTGRAIEETAGEIIDYLREEGCPAVTGIIH